MTAASRDALYAERVVAHDRAAPGYVASWKVLADRLLAEGGDAVVPPMSPETLTAEITAGTTLDGTRPDLRPGVPGDCHTNTRALHRRGAGAGWTGYALSLDGLWRQHSWVVAADRTVVETTEARVLYHGYAYAPAVSVPGLPPLDGYDDVYTADGRPLAVPHDE